MIFWIRGHGNEGTILMLEFPCIGVLVYFSRAMEIDER